MEGFIYPNEAEIAWGLPIVLYPYITGLVAGAFMVSALYHVFGIRALRPLARFSLLTALAFLLVAPLPLMVHLGRPERGIEIFITPNFRSAMAGFGYIWMGYLVLVLVETWLVFRKDIVGKAESSRGPVRVIYSALTLGERDVSDEALEKDDKVIKVLALVGIPAAVLLHGYVGFIFGSVKANDWWSTPLMPLIFLMSAIVSGMALLVVLYWVTMKLTRRPIDHEATSSLSKWLLGFLILDVTLEFLEVLSMLYESEESWEIISELIFYKIRVPYLWLQFVLGSVVPMYILASIAVFRLRNQTKERLAVFAAALVLVGVFAMRWNVVIGGQLFSKSLSGFRAFHLPFLGLEGILVGIVIMTLPFVVLLVLACLLPTWEREERLPAGAVAEHERVPAAAAAERASASAGRGAAS